MYVKSVSHLPRWPCNKRVSVWQSLYSTPLSSDPLHRASCPRWPRSLWPRSAKGWRARTVAADCERGLGDAPRQQGPHLRSSCRIDRPLLPGRFEGPILHAAHECERDRRYGVPARKAYLCGNYCTDRPLVPRCVAQPLGLGHGGPPRVLRGRNGRKQEIGRGGFAAPSRASGQQRPILLVVLA